MCALSAATGCVHWTFNANAAVRAAITIARVGPGNGYVAFIGERAANVYALDATTGAMIWKSHVHDHPFARVTASPTYHDGRLYVGVASGEETAGAVPEYECCTFPGSLVVLGASDGSRRLLCRSRARPQDADPPARQGVLRGRRWRRHVLRARWRHSQQRGCNCSERERTHPQSRDRRTRRSTTHSSAPLLWPGVTDSERHRIR